MSNLDKVMAARSLKNALDRYMEWRGIGQTAVDLIPDEVRRPCGPIRTNENLYWTHTCGKLKLGVIWVRSAWH